MKNLVKLSLPRCSLEETLYPKLRNRVFHYTTGIKFEKIRESGCLFHSGSENLKTTSIYSNNSTGRHLRAVCLFDLRNKTNEQIAPGKSYYDFLSPDSRISSVVYLVVSESFYKDIKTLEHLDESTKEKTMYLPEIEAWHPGNLHLSKIETVYWVDLL